MRKKKILIPALVIMITGLFLQFSYFPKARETKQLIVERRKISSDINELYNFIGGEENLKDNMIKMRESVMELEHAFPPEKEVSNIIKQFNEEAKDLKINVISIKPGDVTNYTDSNGSQFKIFDQPCKTIPFNLSVEARYQGLGYFLDRIELNRNPMVSVKKIEIRKDSNISPKIRADIELIAYVLGE